MGEGGWVGFRHVGFTLKRPKTSTKDDVVLPGLKDSCMEYTG